MHSLLISLWISLVVSFIVSYYITKETIEFNQSDIITSAKRFASSIRLWQSKNERDIAWIQNDIDNLKRFAWNTMNILMSEWIDQHEKKVDICTIEDMKNLSDQKLKFQYVISETEKDNILLIEQELICSKLQKLNIHEDLYEYIHKEVQTKEVWEYIENTIIFYFEDSLTASRMKRYDFYKFIFLVSK